MLETVGLAQDALDVLQHQGWEALLQLTACRKEVQRARLPLPLPWAAWLKARDEQAHQEQQEGVEQGQQEGVEQAQQQHQRQERRMEEGQLGKQAEGEEEASSSPGGSHRGLEPSLEAAVLVGGRADGQLAALQVAAAAMQAQAAGDLEAATGGALVQHLRPQLAAVQVAAAQRAQAADDLEAARGGALVQHLRPQLQVGDAVLACAHHICWDEWLLCCLS